MNSRISTNITIPRQTKGKTFGERISEANNSKGPYTYHYFQADRGETKSRFLLVAVPNKADSVYTMTDNPFKTFSDVMDSVGYFTTYRLIGANQFGSLPKAGILGFHWIKVKPEKAPEFEKFVAEKLHPKVGHLFPDMQMMYYKATMGINKNEYLLIFSIASPAARDKYWPAGKPETELLKAGFKPLNELATALEPFLVKNSYLSRTSGGAASIFESIVWTDYIHSDYLKK